MATFTLLRGFLLLFVLTTVRHSTDGSKTLKARVFSEGLSQVSKPVFSREAMEAFAESVLRPGILVLQLGFLLRLIQLVVSFLQANAWSLRSMVARGNQKWREQWNNITRQYLEEADASDHSGQELARMRCSWTRTTWWVFLTINLPRLLLRQVRRSPGDQTGEEFEIGLVWVCAMGLVIVWCPRLINPCSQDVLYMMAALGMDAAIVIAGLFHNIDVRDVITLTFPGRFMYAVLANRASCVVFCITAHLLQAIHLSVARQAQDSQAAGSGVTIPDLLAIFLAMFWGILAVRRLLLENVLLRVDVQKRTVELGAVSSLLAACYDAVLEVDQGLRLAHDPGCKQYVKRVASCCVRFQGVQSQAKAHTFQANQK